jgi:trans-aconitate methyltransferase
MDWNASVYDDSHHYVSHYGQAVVDLLSPKSGETILDAGCGTGDLANDIASRGASVTGIDPSDTMIKKATAKYPGLRFLQSAIETQPFNHEFDAVFSNAVLHWIKDPQPALQALAKSLKPKGRFVAECGGKDNTKAVIMALCKALKTHGFAHNVDLNPWYFPSPAEYVQLLERSGFEIKKLYYFDRPTPLDPGKESLRKWLLMFAGPFLEGIDHPTIEAILANVETALEPHLYKNNVWTLDFKRLRFKAVRAA